ncbi:MAG: hypothetical protein ACT4O9_02280, partial [Blastocatellia bacterium]
AGRVPRRKDGNWPHYKITPPENNYAAEVFSMVREWIKHDPEMQADRLHLVNMCCAPASMQPIGIIGAPKPKTLVA